MNDERGKVMKESKKARLMVILAAAALNRLL
jgi:hypothetical protein